MAESLALVWDLIARDQGASSTFARVGASAEGASGSVGKLLGGFTALAAGGAIAASVKAAADFQSQMLLVQTQAGATSKEVADMSPKILALAGQVAQAPEALATSLYHVESTGLRGAQALDAVKVAAEGAKVGHADLEQTTNALTATIASGMLPATESYAQAMGQLNTIVGSGDMKMSDLNDALASGLLVTTKQYGITINDVGAALADFGDNNIRGSDAATMLRMAVQAIAKPGKDAAGALGEVGLTVAQLQKDEQTGGLNKALTDLHTHLVNSGIDASQWGTILTDAFTKKAGTGLLTLVGTFDRFQQKYQEVSKGADSFGNAWTATTQSAAFQATRLKDAVEATGIKIGTGLLPYVTDLEKHVADFINSQGFQDFLSTVGNGAVTAGHAIGGLVSGFMDLPAPIKDTAVALAALALAEKIGLLDKFGSGVGAVRTAFREFAADVSATRGVLEQAGVPLAGLSATATVTAEKGLGALKSAGQGVMNMFGGPWGLALAGAGIAASLVAQRFQEGSQATQDWTTALEQGGAAARDAQAAMDAQNAELAKNDQGFMGFINKIDGYSAAQRAAAGSTSDAKKAAQDHYNSLGLVDQKTIDVNNATDHLQQVLKDHATNTLAAKEAENQLQIAQGDLKVAQDELNQSTKSAVQLTQEQAQAALNLAGSGLNAKQSYDEFSSSLAQYRADVASGKVSTGDLTREQDALNTSTINVTQSAGSAGEAWAKANGVTDTGTASQYAQLLALEKVSKAMGTDTPAAVTNLIGSLQASVAQGSLTQTQMDGIAASVDGIPGQKKIDVTADTSQAQDELNNLIKSYQHISYTGTSIMVNGRVVANADGNLLPMSATKASIVSPGTLRVIGDNPVADEAFIPINSSARSLSILGETAARMGMGLHAMADGGFVTSTDQFFAQPSQGWMDSIRAFGQSAVQAAAVAASAGGAARWRPLVDQVLGMLGIPLSADNGVLSLINSESGGNPNAINLTDSNALAGHPSQGLMQTIPATFARWRSPSLPNNILDPLANIYAGVNYALHTYGLGMLTGGGNHVGGRYVGYKDGTNWVPETGLALLHKGESVVPVAQNQGGPYSSGPMEITGTLRIDGDGLAHIVDGRIVRAQGRAQLAAAAGSSSAIR